MNNIFKQVDFNQGFLKCEHHIDSSWISSAIQKDDKLQEIINVAQNIKNIEILNQNIKNYFNFN